MINHYLFNYEKNNNDNNPKRNKGIMKTLVFSTVVFILTTIAEK
jgi:hypothetical protein